MVSKKRRDERIALQKQLSAAASEKSSVKRPSDATQGGKSSQRKKQKSKPTDGESGIAVDQDHEQAPRGEVSLLSQTLSRLGKTFSITSSQVISSSKIQAKVRTILSTLRHDQGSNPSLLLLSAELKCASKLITIVEIAKREIGPGFHQYTTVTDKSEPSKVHGSQKATGNISSLSVLQDNLMLEKSHRALSMTILLSLREIEDLKHAYGGQST